MQYLVMDSFVFAQTVHIKDELRVRSVFKKLSTMSYIALTFVIAMPPNQPNTNRLRPDLAE